MSLLVGRLSCLADWRMPMDCLSLLEEAAVLEVVVGIAVVRMGRCPYLRMSAVAACIALAVRMDSDRNQLAAVADMGYC